MIKIMLASSKKSISVKLNNSVLTPLIRYKSNW